MNPAYEYFYRSWQTRLGRSAETLRAGGRGAGKTATAHDELNELCRQIAEEAAMKRPTPAGHCNACGQSLPLKAGDIVSGSYRGGIDGLRRVEFVGIVRGTWGSYVNLTRIADGTDVTVKREDIQSRLHGVFKVTAREALR